MSLRQAFTPSRPASRAGATTDKAPETTLPARRHVATPANDPSSRLPFAYPSKPRTDAPDTNMRVGNPSNRPLKVGALMKSTSHGTSHSSSLKTRASLDSRPPGDASMAPPPPRGVSPPPTGWKNVTHTQQSGVQNIDIVAPTPHPVSPPFVPNGLLPGFKSPAPPTRKMSSPSKGVPGHFDQVAMSHSMQSENEDDSLIAPQLFTSPDPPHYEDRSDAFEHMQASQNNDETMYTTQDPPPSDQQGRARVRKSMEHVHEEHARTTKRLRVHPVLHDAYPQFIGDHELEPENFPSFADYPPAKHFQHVQPGKTMPSRGGSLARAHPLGELSELEVGLLRKMEEKFRRDGEDEAASARWTECSMEEWMNGAKALCDKFQRVTEMVTKQMTRRLQSYEGDYARVEQHRRELSQRAKSLAAVQASLIRGSGTVLEGTEES